MPSFSFKPVVKAKAKSYSESTSKYNIIATGIEGTVFITIDGKYIVVVGDDKYDIVTECYSCKGVSEIYEQTLSDNITRVRHIRSEKDRDDRDRTMYLPFTAGCSVKGNIVRYKAANTVIFKIKKVWIDVECEVAKDAIRFYRKNYLKIRDKITKDWIDNYKVKEEQTIVKDKLAQFGADFHLTVSENLEK